MKDKSYLLDSRYADYIKNFLSEFHPKMLLQLNVEDELNKFIIDVGTIGETEYLEYYDALPNDPKKVSTNHLMAKEYANEKMKEYIKMILQ